MTAVVDRTNIFSAPYDNVYSLIDDRSNVADPKDGIGDRVFVYDSDPFVKGMGFKGFPYIVVKMPALDQESSSANNKYNWLTYSQRVIVRTAKDGSGGSIAGTGHADMQAIINDLIETFNSAANKQTLRDYQMKNTNIRVVDTDDTAIESQKAIFETELEISYDFRMQVSA